MRKYKYADKIIEVIKQGKSMPNFSVTDYLNPVRELYSNLSEEAKQEFHLSLLALLQGRDYLEEIADICVDIKLKKACPILINLFLNIPKKLKEEGQPIWLEGLRRSLIASLGELGCKCAIPILKKILDAYLFRKKSKIPALKRDGYCVVMQALTKLSPKEASKYFGWWLKKAQEIDCVTRALAKGTDDWIIMENMNIAPDIDSLALGCGANSVRISLFNIMQKYKMKDFEKWLKSVSLVERKDRGYLQYQLGYLLEGKDEFCDLKKIFEFKSDTKLLALKLASLPS